MDPFTIGAWILGMLGGAAAAAIVWSAFSGFMETVIRTILPNKYGEAIARFVRKVIGIIRRLLNVTDVVELVADAVEISGVRETVQTDTVSWSEVPIDVRNVLNREGKYVQTYEI